MSREVKGKGKEGEGVQNTAMTWASIFVGIGPEK
jgi:hypothetical protein